MQSANAFSNNNEPVRDRRINVVQDTIRTYPELWLECFVVTDVRSEAAMFAEWLVRSRCTKSDSVDNADIVIFTGGADVDPALYGETKHRLTRPNPRRDALEMEIFYHCRENGIPMLGICRGAQFLHVMNGGKLFQDVDHHYGDHSMRDIVRDRVISKVSSVHHQMVMPHKDMTVIAEAYKSKKRYHNDTTVEESENHKDIEAFFYRDTCSLGIQGHPEYSGYTDFQLWASDTIDHYINQNPDIAWIDRMRRVKPDLIEQRKLGWTAVQ